MKQQDALSVLISAIKIANKRGVFEIEESSAIFEAIKVFTPNNVDKELGDTEDIKE